LELTIQKKLARKLYGIACLSYFRSQYCNVAGAWRNRIYDNRFTFSYDGGYKPNNKFYLKKNIVAYIICTCTGE
jgi:hypothetical protein